MDKIIWRDVKLNFLELAKERYSVRKYQDKMVNDKDIKKVLEAGRIAPSACNLQPRYFIVVKDKSKKRELESTYKGSWIKEAPVIIVICGNHQESWKRKDGKDHCDIDAAIAVDHMTLAAASLGLGTCWICAFDAEKCSDIFNLPEHIEAVALLPLGYPADSSDPERHSGARKNIEDIVSWN